MTSGPSPRRLFLLVLLAALLLQTAWILALPAFRGSDEFDHVNKAEAVAYGQLLDAGPTDAGRGGLITVPEDVVAAASAMCLSYDYTGPDNCNPVQELGGGMVTVANAASTYNPTYYAVVGLMARPFSGAATDFAMRTYTAVLAALLLAWAAVVTSGWARNSWPLLALLVTATPVLVYSTAVASPNGVGYAAGCLLWAAGLGLVESPRRPQIVAITTAALTLMVTHATGVMWLALVVAAIALLQPPSLWASLFHVSRRALLVCATVVGAGGLACTAWMLVARTTAPPPVDGEFGQLAFHELVTGQFVWALQTIAAFPLRNEPAPVIVYVLWLLPVGTLLAIGIRRASRRLRLIALGLLTAWVVVPVALTMMTYASMGLAWQGRYALPLAIGFPALAGLALSRSARGPSKIHVVFAVALCAVAQTVSVVRVAWVEADRGLSPSFVSSVPAGIGVVVVLALTGSLLPMFLARNGPTGGRADAGRQLPVSAVGSVA